MSGEGIQRQFEGGYRIGTLPHHHGAAGTDASFDRMIIKVGLGPRHPWKGGGEGDSGGDDEVRCWKRDRKDRLSTPVVGAKRRLSFPRKIFGGGRIVGGGKTSDRRFTGLR